MDNLEVGRVWKTNWLPGLMLEISEVTDKTITCVSCNPQREVIAYTREKFLETFDYHLPEYKVPYDAGSEYV